MFVRLARVLVAVSIVVLSMVSSAAPQRVISAVSAAEVSSVCIGHHPQPSIWYTGGCTGHDEPEIDPLSSNPGSAQDLTWTFVMPTNGSAPVDSVGPTFWTGGTVTDPNSMFEQAFLEVQFYPNSMVTSCPSNGGYVYTYAPNQYTACSPVWKVTQKGAEVAAFNAMLTDSKGGGPLVMNAGDTITDHQYITKQADGMHITVTDVTTGHSGTIILNSKQDGPLMPAYSVQKIGNDLGWGLTYDAPNSFVWEIGHTGNFTKPPGQFCLPGSKRKPLCFSYNVSTWLAFTPIQIQGVKFGDGSQARSWAVDSDFGGKAEIYHYCGKENYGKPFCWYPWYAYNDSLKAFTYGGDYPGTSEDFGQANQFQQQLLCPGPFGPDTTYCATVIK
ncbi:MAG TPA: hypothetical protein VKX16_00075 [Chloroflexota bacterium]|nr:hypothetical protein [Chloroflexota bacterium]